MKSAKKSSKSKSTTSRKPKPKRTVKKPKLSAKGDKSLPKRKRVGIFGGTFDPLHLGHINSIQTVLESHPFDVFKVIPAFQSPNRPQMEGPTPDQRFEMVRLGLEGLDPRIEIDDLEILRGGTSYTIETLKALEKKDKHAQFSLIVGADQLDMFDRWKDYATILEKVDLIVTSRPGALLPTEIGDLAAGLRPHVLDFDENGNVVLTTGRTIQFIQLDDVEVSATEVRRRFRAKESVKDLIPHQVEAYIRGQGLYESLGSRIGDFAKFTVFCSKVLQDKGGIQVLAFDLRSLQHPSEFTVVASGTSTRHTQALAETVMKSVKENYGVWPQSLEGLKEGRWVVIDYGSLIVHVFYDFIRNEYRLEQLWKEAQEVDMGGGQVVN